MYNILAVSFSSVTLHCECFIDRFSYQIISKKLSHISLQHTTFHEVASSWETVSFDANYVDIYGIAFIVMSRLLTQPIAHDMTNMQYLWAWHTLVM